MINLGEKETFAQKAKGRVLSLKEYRLFLDLTNSQYVASQRLISRKGKKIIECTARQIFIREKDQVVTVNGKEIHFYIRSNKILQL